MKIKKRLRGNGQGYVLLSLKTRNKQEAQKTATTSNVFIPLATIYAETQDIQGIQGIQGILECVGILIYNFYFRFGFGTFLSLMTVC